MGFAIVIRRLSYDLDTGEELDRQDSAPIDVSDLEILAWLEKGYRPWELRLGKEITNAAH